MKRQRILRNTNIINTRKNLFYSKVLLPDENGCMNWIGGLKHSGYGIMHNKTIKAKTAHTLAHRYSYQLHYGINPKKLFVCHICDNRLCVTPEHLFLGNYLDNINDMNKKKRQAFGEKNGQSKLTEKQVLRIRKLLKNKITSTAIAKVYQVSQSIISDIKLNKSWRNL